MLALRLEVWSINAVRRDRVLRMQARKLLFLPPFVIGVVGLVWLMELGAGRDAGGAAPAPVPVQVIELATTEFTPLATGFGRVEAERTWRAITQVSGRVDALAEGLAVGKRLAADTLLVSIDRRDYEIAYDKAKANLATAKASLNELDVEEANTAALLEIEKRVEEVARSDFERQRALQERGTASQASVDDSERALLGQERVVQELENQIRLQPVQKISLQETIRTREVELEEAQRDLDNTRIIAPFEGRVSEKSVSLAQFVRDGDALLTLEDISTVEVLAEFQPSSLRGLIATQGDDALARLISSTHGSGALTALLRLGFSAQVIGRISGDTFVWDAEIVRFNGRIDEETGTIGIAVRVQDPAQPDIATRRPPLNPGAFVEVRISAPSKPMLLIPRGALRRDPGRESGAFVYVMDAEETLRRAPVTLGPSFDDHIVVADGVAPGAQVIASDLNPAILGMRLMSIGEAEYGRNVLGAKAGAP